VAIKICQPVFGIHTSITHFRADNVETSADEKPIISSIVTLKRIKGEIPNAKTKTRQQCQKNPILARNMPKLQQNMGKSIVDNAAKRPGHQGLQTLRRKLKL
jgi:hypothetical protein